MKHKFECPHCRQRISATPDLFGQRRRCPACEQEFIVPAPEEPQPPSASISTSGPLPRAQPLPSPSQSSAQPLLLLSLGIILLLSTALIIQDLLRCRPPIAILYPPPSPPPPAREHHLSDLQQRLDAQQAELTSLKTSAGAH